ncbi:MAG: FISUMP domain-containing protein [Patescibacteria group bacterium]|nr:MAG: FISUMP domain-containing protein [Patescibacteria group bacterium]
MSLFLRKKSRVFLLIAFLLIGVAFSFPSIFSDFILKAQEAEDLCDTERGWVKQGEYCQLILTANPGYNHLFLLPDDWNNNDNTIEVIGGGGSGAVSSGELEEFPTGGLAGEYKVISNFSNPGTSLVYRLGLGGSSRSKTSGVWTGQQGGDTFFNRVEGDSNTCEDNSSVCAQGGEAGYLSDSLLNMDGESVVAQNWEDQGLGGSGISDELDGSLTADNGGLYGGGGGACYNSSLSEEAKCFSGAGAQGVIVITYLPQETSEESSSRNSFFTPREKKSKTNDGLTIPEYTLTSSHEISISLTTDGVVNFGNMDLDDTLDSTPSGLNKIQTVSVDQGTVELDISSTNFTSLDPNTWSLSTTNGEDQVKWDFSTNGSSWTTFAVANTLYNLATNVTAPGTKNIFFRLTTPSTTNDLGSYEAQVTIVASEYNFICGTSNIYDQEDNEYGTVDINGQCWMASHLNTKIKPDGTCINGGGNPPCPNASSGDDGLGRSCYNNSESNCSSQGSLYTWAAAMNGIQEEGAQGICPVGWHVPTDAEWHSLELHLTDNEETCDPNRNFSESCQGAGTKLKPGGSSNFEFTMAGRRLENNSFSDQNWLGYGWSSTGSNQWFTSLRTRTVHNSLSTVGRAQYSPDFGFSLRCIKDLPTYTLTYSAGDNGSITGEASQTVVQGSDGTAVTAVPDVGYVFSQWSDAVQTAERTDTNVTQDITVTAIFEVAPFVCGTSNVYDYEGNAYTTVELGYRCWMKENLNTKVKPNGTCINGGGAPPCPTASASDNGLGRSCYSNDEANCTTDGSLYTWAGAMDGSTTPGAQGICPTGWHIPTDNEFKAMEMGIGMSQGQVDATDWRGTDEGRKLKSQRTVNGSPPPGIPTNDHPRWNYHTNFGTDTSGFSALPAGFRNTAGSSFNERSADAYFWSSSPSGGSTWGRALVFSEARVYRVVYLQANSFSLRCVKDPETYNLEYSAGANGSISGTASQSVVHGDNGSTVTAVPDVGYAFLEWSDGVQTAARTDMYVTENISVTAEFYEAPFVCGTSSIYDYEGNAYTTVELGYRCWMAQNLRTKHKPNGDLLTNLTNGSERDCISSSNTRGTEADCTAGYALYTWAGAMNGSTTPGAQGICPTGWHVPTDQEQHMLELSLTDQAQTCDPQRASAWDCDSAGTKLKTGGSSGFNAILTGRRDATGAAFFSYGDMAGMWSSSENIGNQTLAWRRNLFLVNSTVNRNSVDKLISFTVRCVKDPETYSLEYSAGANGSISGTASQSVVHGDHGSTVTAVPDVGYAFLEWSDNVQTAARTDMYVTGNISVTAQFYEAPSVQETPTFNPAGGAIAFGTTVVISSPNADAIYYTTDGSTPTTSSTNQAVTPLVINSNVTVKAIAVRAGYSNSEVATTSYTQAASANLTNIVLSGSPIAYSFSGGTYTYNEVNVLNGVSSITVTPTGPGAITVDGVSVNSGSPSGAISLTPWILKSINITTTETGKSPKTYIINITRRGNIGDSHAGGYVAYIDSSGIHGFVVSTADLSTTAQWGCEGVNIAGATGQAIGTGAANTTAILAGCGTSGIAARLAANHNGGGFSGWYLPSKDELQQIRNNSGAIPGWVNSGWMWTSSQASATAAWEMALYDAAWHTYAKSGNFFKVRAIRNF